MDYEYILEKVKEIIKEAGLIIKDGFYHRENSQADFTIKVKNTVDLVTETDKKSEDFLFNKLKEAFPNIRFVGEEGVSVSKSHKINLTDEPTWIIDPLDGTTNFVHFFPMVCISIALVVDKEPVLGVIYNPITNEMYWGIKGKGSFKDGKQLPLIKNNSFKSLQQCTIITEYGYDRTPELIQKKLDTLKKLISYPIHGVRSFGSAALHMCLIACGSADIFFEAGMHAWDIAAGSLIIKEAGGAAVNWKRYDNVTKDTLISDEKLDLIGRHVLCIRKVEEGKIHQSEILNEIRERLIDFPIETD